MAYKDPVGNEPWQASKSKEKTAYHGTLEQHGT